jgi:pyruvate formate lyase activating enzyme
VTLSGGECLCHADFCAELLRKLKAEGISTAVDTCGFVSRAAIDAVLPYTDVFLYDVKAIDPEVHERCTGHGNAEILENLKYLDSAGAKIEVRYPFVPHYNSEEAEKIGEFLSGLKNLLGVRVLGYHKFAGSKYDSLDMENRLPEDMPTDAELEKAKESIRKFGIRIID